MQFYILTPGPASYHCHRFGSGAAFRFAKKMIFKLSSWALMLLLYIYAADCAAESQRRHACRKPAYTAFRRLQCLEHLKDSLLKAMARSRGRERPLQPRSDRKPVTPLMDGTASLLYLRPHSCARHPGTYSTGLEETSAEVSAGDALLLPRAVRAAGLRSPTRWPGAWQQAR